MHCSVCDDSIGGYYYRDELFGTLACNRCYTTRCTWCTRYAPTIEFEDYETCNDCLADAVISETQFEGLIRDARPILSTHLGPNRYSDIRVRFMTDEESLRYRLGQAFFGGSYPPLIELKPGMPYSKALAVLLHEYGHMALNLNHHTLDARPHMASREPMIEEGFCEVLYAVALMTQTTPVARAQSFLLPGNPDPVYGDGFRLMWQRALDLGSVGALLEELTREPHSFRGPSVDLVHDDFVVPDDIAPLVEAGGGGECGPLRGKAVKVTELPDDAPRGPRLRGKGVALAERPTTTTSPTPPGATPALRGKGLGGARVTSPDRDKSDRGSGGGLRGKGLD